MGTLLFINQLITVVNGVLIITYRKALSTESQASPARLMLATSSYVFPMTFVPIAKIINIQCHLYYHIKTKPQDPNNQRNEGKTLHLHCSTWHSEVHMNVYAWYRR